MVIMRSSIFKSTQRRFLSNTLRLHKLDIGSFNDDHITIVLDHKNAVRFNNIFLRDSCNNEFSVNPFSKQKSFSTADVSSGLSLSEPPMIEPAKDTHEDMLRVDWKQNGKVHTSYYPEGFLKKYSSEKTIRSGKYFEKMYWNRSVIMSKLNKVQVNYTDFFQDTYFYESVKSINECGLAFVNAIPDPSLSSDIGFLTEENHTHWPVAKLASRFGYLKKTFYGSLFDVKNEKKAKNIANTDTYLPLHMDLLYYESPPGLQFLHFIRNSTKGGENIFTDSFLAAEYVKETDAIAYDALKKVPLTFHYDNNGEFYLFSRPLVIEETLESGNQIVEVNYSPPFQAPFEFPICKSPETEALFKDFLRGLRIFEKFINDPHNQLKLKMKEGSCVIFDNRRILHSRMAFSDDSGQGSRWLMGAYVDGDSFRSKLRMGYRFLHQ